MRLSKNISPRPGLYAVKANPEPAIVKTLFDLGASFDISSMPEFRVVYENIKDMPEEERYEWIRDKIIYANPIKAEETLMQLDRYSVGHFRQPR